MANYTDSTYADTYFSTRLNVTPWTEASSGDKTKALTMATEYIDRLNFIGEVTDTAQVNQFPRDDETTIPDDVKKACCEIALSLLDGVDPDVEFENLQMTRFTYDAVTTQYSRLNPPGHILSGIPSVIAWRLLYPFLRDKDGINLNRVT